MAGDRVAVAPDESGSWTVERTLERASELVHAGPGGRHPRVVAANVDRLFVVMSAVEPPFRPELADRFLVLAEASDLPGVLLLNKMDLPGARPVANEIGPRYRSAGYRVLLTSAASGEGIEGLRALLAQGVSVLAGPSGVGKSTLLNAVAPGLRLRTGEVSRRGGTGRHTTVGARLLALPAGGWVVDTPGFSDVGLGGVDPSFLPFAFPEFQEHAALCRFSGCSHVHEPECAVRDAVDAGEISPERYESYRLLLEEER